MISDSSHQADELLEIPRIAAVFPRLVLRTSIGMLNQNTHRNLRHFLSNTLKQTCKPIGNSLLFRDVAAVALEPQDNILALNLTRP